MDGVFPAEKRARERETRLTFVFVRPFRPLACNDYHFLRERGNAVRLLDEKKFVESEREHRAKITMDPLKEERRHR